MESPSRILQTCVAYFIYIYSGRYLQYANCPFMEDYSPCECPFIKSGLMVSYVVLCQKMKPKKIIEVFEQTIPVDIDHLFLVPPWDPDWRNIYIPSDLLVEHRVTKSISILNVYHSQKIMPYLSIDPEAFRLSRNYTQDVSLTKFSLTNSSLSFLVGFNQLKKLVLKKCSNFQLLEIPTLDNLTELWIEDCTGVNAWTNFPHLTSGLTFLGLPNVGISDLQADRIFHWLLKGPSKETLWWITLTNNFLTRVPNHIEFFTKMRSIDLSGQIPPGFISLSKLVLPASLYFEINLAFCFISSIEPGAFQGMYYSENNKP